MRPTCLCSRWGLSVEGDSIILSHKEKKTHMRLFMLFYGGPRVSNTEQNTTFKKHQIT